MAAAQCGRKAYGFEIDRIFYDKANRLVLSRIQKTLFDMRNKELIALLQEQDPEAEVMIRTSDGEYEYDPVDVTWDEEIECVIIQEG